MSFHPLQITEFKNGVTPATGTIALGTTFQAEFVQLYENDNFLKTYFTTNDRLTIDEIEGKTGNLVKFLDPIGLNIAPVTNLHLHQLDSGANLMHFTNTSTGLTAADGLDIGIDASEQGRIWNYENTDIVIGTNNVEYIRLQSTGQLGIGTTAVKGTVGKVHILSGSANADTNWNATCPVIIERNDHNLLNIRTPNDKIGGIVFSDPDAVQSGYIRYNHSDDSMQFHTANVARTYLNATGFGIGVTPSNPLHVMSTTTPQVRIGYDVSNYITMDVSNVGTLSITCGATGSISIVPGTSNNIVVFGSDATLAIYASSYTKYGTINHNGTNLVLSTGGTTPGNILISNTTEATSSTAAALISSGGIAAAGKIWAGGDIITNTGNINIVAGDLQFNGNPVAGWLDDGTPYYKKSINIGDWNMDSTTNVNINHGCTYANIIGVQVIIKEDGDGNRYFLQDNNKGSVDIGTTQVVLWRTTGGYFDNVLFDATSFNRGFIWITYI